MEQKILQPSSVWVFFIPGMSQTLPCLLQVLLLGGRKGHPIGVHGSSCSHFSSLSLLCHSFLEKREFEGNLPWKITITLLIG